MPTYAYRCSRCDHGFDAFQPITASALRRCPKCGKNSLERVVTGGAGILVGGSSGGSGSDGGAGSGAESGSGHAGGSGAATPAATGGGANAAGGTPAGAAGAGSAGSAGPGGGDSRGASGASGGAGGAGGTGGASGGAGGAGAASDAGRKAGDPERDAWRSKATHPSREGRGIGNMRSLLKGGPQRGFPKGGGGGRGRQGGTGRPPRRGR
ncbi:MAG: zinc ribbon domain-containing protein [Phycisphaerales bacterium]